MLDYLNTMDLIVRKIELNLGIQDRNIQIGADSVKMTEAEKSTMQHKSESGSIFDSNLNNQLDQKTRVDEKTQTMEEANDKLNEESKSVQPKKEEKEVKIRDMGYDSDDVFANNPSTLMLAKFKVIRPKKSVIPEVEKATSTVKDEPNQGLKNVKFDVTEHT